MTELTAKDVLKLVSERAQWCRENGESDMRNILNTTRTIGASIDKGMSREEILAEYVDEEDED